MNNDNLPSEQPAVASKPTTVSASPPKASPRTSPPTMALVLGCFLVGTLGGGLVVAADRAIGDSSPAAVTNTTRQVVSSEGELVAQIATEVGASTVSITTEAASGRDLFGQSAIQEGAGTGIIISQDGYVMTNRHVVPEGTRNVTVTLSDGTEYTDVTVVGRDTLNDIAFVKINNPGKQLAAAKIGDSSQIKVGQKVVAVGNALGQFQNTVTTGVISGLSRPVTAGGESGEATEQLSNLFQTDAAINPGNSGGPLVNMSGEVIGMNTAVAAEAEGIGFAIPVNDTKGLITSVTEEGRLIRPFLGVRTVTLSAATARQLDTDETSGAYVVENGVVDGSPADQAGIRPGDVITKVNNITIGATNPISSAVGSLAVGQQVDIVLKRDGQEQTVRATLREAGR